MLKNKPDKEVVEQLSRKLNINNKLTELLVHRGVTTYDEAKSFFRPQLSGLLDPFLMKDMDKAVDRINRARKNGEKIMIYGDYDVDGTTAVSIVYSFLKNISSLKTQVTEFEIESLSTDNVESIEKQILDNYTAKNPTNFNKYLPQLMSTLSIEKNEDEKSIIYENRLLSDLKSILEIEEVLV